MHIIGTYAGLLPFEKFQVNIIPELQHQPIIAIDYNLDEDLTNYEEFIDIFQDISDLQQIYRQEGWITKIINTIGNS